MKKYYLEIRLLISVLIVASIFYYLDEWSFSTKRLINEVVRVDDRMIKPTVYSIGNQNLKYSLSYYEKTDFNTDSKYAFSSLYDNNGVSSTYSTNGVDNESLFNDILNFRFNKKENGVKTINEDNISEFLNGANLDNIVHTIRKVSTYHYTSKEINYLVTNNSIDSVKIVVQFTDSIKSNSYFYLWSRKLNSNNMTTKGDLIRQWKLTLISTDGLKGELYKSPQNINFPSVLFYMKDDYAYEFFLSAKGNMTDEEYINLIKENLK